MIVPQSNPMANEQDLAQQLLDTMRSLYQPQHTFQAVDAKTFRHLDLQFYHRTQKTFEQLGWQKIADIEDVTVTQVNPKGRTFIRVFLSGDRTLVGACYHFPLGWLVRLLQWVGLAPKGGKVIDLETELNDGSFVVTSNSLEMDTTADVPGVWRQQLPHYAGVDILLQRHRAKVQELSRQDIRPIQLNNYSEIEASQHRLQAIKSGYRAEVGYLTDEDIDRTAKDHQQQAAATLKQALQEIHRNAEPMGQ
jgi:hypothetical protein